ncbi:MAG: riboflavin synthase [Sulfobacillus acidophilus]|uniref:Riboflavin synthase n=1 Tax=Sulfobacillus acidophilus TaxID=53633 RepID=A0A2T2WGE2_9FIRM|nr:MAG: riboflavin synthase [Sulfobacillus acidophilus]
MFTGLVEAIGTVIASEPDRDQVGQRLQIAVPFSSDLTLGESISVNGTCLTVVASNSHSFWVQVSSTTLAFTTLGHLAREEQVNLERSVTPATRLGGHWVLGHVDTRGTVQTIVPDGESHHITVTYANEYDRWVLPQGSITLDGISLTIVRLSPGQLTVTVIPHTWSHTTVQNWRVGLAVNLEFDVLGKYVERLLQPYQIGKGGR